MLSDLNHNVETSAALSIMFLYICGCYNVMHVANRNNVLL